MAPLSISLAVTAVAAAVAHAEETAGASAKCWSGPFTAERCCNLQAGPTGDKACWAGDFSFEDCCPSGIAAVAKRASSKATVATGVIGSWPLWAQKAVRTLGAWIVLPLPTVAAFLTRELPDLLALSAKALRKMKLPTTYDAFLSMSQSQALDLAPPLCALITVAVVPFVLLLGDRRPRKAVPEPSESFWLTRLCLLRGLGLCYLCGFLTSALQHRALWGSQGLEPLEPSFPSRRPTPAFDILTVAFPLVPFDCLLELVSWTGVALSLTMMWSRFSSCLLPAALWVLYLSIVNLQAPFTYSYGWEWLTCEAGFLAIFLCPLPLGTRFPASSPPPRLVLWLFRWLAFRLLLGAGLSKVGRNSSACWRDLTCTTTHYFTQPIPNPVSWFAHHAPEWVHRLEVALTFVEQLVLPFFMLVPEKWCRRFAGLAEMFFQFMIVATGNYAWINFIGAVPCISLLDDELLGFVLSHSTVQAARSAAEAAALTGLGVVRRSATRLLRLVHNVACLALVLFMVYKSKDPIREMFSPAPWINNYDQWFLMNSQGVFGFINTHRVNLVLEYTHSENPRSIDAAWKPLDFKCIPGSTDRLPCLLSPYHSRLDWETWIRTTASLEHLFEQKAPPQEYFNHFPPFAHSLIMRVLHGDDDSAALLGIHRSALYPGGTPPTGIKARFFSYTFTTIEKWWQTGHWWHREPLDDVGGIVFDASQQPLHETDIRKTPAGRTTALLVSTSGIVLAAAGLLGTGTFGDGGLAYISTSALPLLVLCCGVFGAALLADYPKLYDHYVISKLGHDLSVPGLPDSAWDLACGLAHAGFLIAVAALARAIATCVRQHGSNDKCHNSVIVTLFAEAPLLVVLALLCWSTVL